MKSKPASPSAVALAAEPDRPTAARSKRRKPKSAHPGVGLLAPIGRHGWRAKYRDPDSGRVVRVSLDPHTARTLETRAAWAKAKSKELARRRGQLESGAPRATGASIADALAKFVAACAHLRPRTREVYRRMTVHLTQWCAAEGLKSFDQFTRAHAVRFRESVIATPRFAPVRKGAPGEHVATSIPRAAETTNKVLRSVVTCLRYLGSIDLLPRCTSDDISRGLKRVIVPHEQLTFMKPHELRTLLGSALRHDRATFGQTRGERAAADSGKTPKHPVIAPFTAAAILTGMRFGELHDLMWDAVDLDAPDDAGNPVGEIRIGAASKTHRSRSVDLSVSPMLRQLLAALKLRTGGAGRVFGLTRGEAITARDRLGDFYGAPKVFDWQCCRRTTGTVLTNAAGIFGSASAYRSARQLGHSVTVAEKHYLGLLKGLPRDARSIEAAVGIEAELRQIVEAVTIGRMNTPEAQRERVVARAAAVAGKGLAARWGSRPVRAVG